MLGDRPQPGSLVDVAVETSGRPDALPSGDLLIQRELREFTVVDRYMTTPTNEKERDEDHSQHVLRY